MLVPLDSPHLPNFHSLLNTMRWCSSALHKKTLRHAKCDTQRAAQSDGGTPSRCQRIAYAQTSTATFAAWAICCCVTLGMKPRRRPTKLLHVNKHRPQRQPAPARASELCILRCLEKRSGSARAEGNQVERSDLGLQSRLVKPEGLQRSWERRWNAPGPTGQRRALAGKAPKTANNSSMTSGLSRREDWKRAATSRVFGAPMVQSRWGTACKTSSGNIRFARTAPRKSMGLRMPDQPAASRDATLTQPQRSEAVDRMRRMTDGIARW